MSNKLLRYIGLAFILGLGVWITVALTTGGERFPIYQFPDATAKSFTSVAKSDSMKMAFERAVSKVTELNRSGARIGWLSEICVWASFFVTSLLALVAGTFGYKSSSDMGQNHPAGKFTTLGFVAALASLLTATGSFSVERSQERFKRADELTKIVQETDAALRSKPEDESRLELNLINAIGRT
jgi:hypothetical protein